MILRTDYSDACPPTTQRCYHMPQRSPVIFWLLLAATISVDAVATAWMFDDLMQPMAVTLFIAMAYSQVSILCAWAVLCRPAIWIRWLVPFGVGFVVALIMTAAEIHLRTGQSFRWEQLLAFFRWELLLAYTSLMWVHVATLLLLLWFLKPTRLFANYLGRTNQWSWQFTTKHLLLLMTCLPILVIVFKKSAIVRSGVTAHGFVEFVAWVVGNVLLLLAVAVTVQRKWKWVLRLAASAGAALVIGPFLQWAVPELSRTVYITAFSLIQAFVVWAWLETIRPHDCADIVNADESQPLEVEQ